MTEYELCKLAETADEDAFEQSDLEPIAETGAADSFKEDYLGFYDDIKLTPGDDW